MLWKELVVHAAIPSDQDIEVMMCRCKDMEVKSRSRKDLVFPIDIVLHIMVVEKTRMVNEMQV